LATGKGEIGYRLLAPLCVGAMLNPINSTMIATALTDIREHFEASTASVLWLVSLMYLASAVGQPVAGQLADRVGPRKVFVTGMVLVAVAGVVGTLAPSLLLLLLARLIVGLGTGAAYPAAVTMIEQQGRRSAVRAPSRALGVLMTVSLTALTFGPPLGGILVEAFGWRAVFAANVPLAVVPLALGFIWLPRDENPRARGHAGADYVGIGLFTLALAVFLTVTMHIERLGWYAVPAVLIATAPVLIYERRLEAPFLDVRMLARVPTLSFTYLRLALTFTVIYGVMFGLASWLTEARGVSPATAGLLLLGMSGAAALASALSGRYRQVQLPLFVGTSSLLAASLMMLGIDTATGIAYLAAVCVLFGIPNGLNLVANQLAVFRAAPSGQTGIASGFFRTSQYVGAMAATGVISVCYAAQATDDGLHRLAWSFVMISVVLLIARVAHLLLTLAPGRTR
jgi:predicted MFS family arabinose efflux permease